MAPLPLWAGRMLALAALVAGALLAVIPMLAGGHPLAHSIHFNLMWAHQYASQALAGQWLPRWLEASFFGLGCPSFVFYPPFSMLATLPFAAWGLPAGGALVDSMFLCALLRGAGSYRAARVLWDRPLAAATGVVAALSPYFLVDVYVRGAIGEAWAMAFFPWALWAAWRALPEPGTDPPASGSRGLQQRRRLAALALAVAAIALSHLPALVVFLAVLWTLPLSLAEDRASFSRLALRLLGGAAAGLALAAFFLLPAALDQREVSIDLINGWEMYNPLTRFMLNGFRLTSREFDVGLRACFVTPFWIAVAAALVSRRSRDREWRVLVSLTVVTMLATFMMTDLSAGAYQSVLALWRIQFPWRFMTVTATAVPFLLAFLVRASGAQPTKAARIVARIATGVLALLTLLQSFLLVWSEPAGQTLYAPGLVAAVEEALASRPPFPQEPAVDPAHVERLFGWHYATPNGIAFVDAFEYRPRTASNSPVPPPRPYDLAEWTEGAGTVEVTAWGYGVRRLKLTASATGVLALRTFAYPAWTATLNRQQVATGVTRDGRITIPIAPGTWELEVRYTGTPAERAGAWISLVALLALALLTLAPAVAPPATPPDAPPGR